MMLVIPSLLLTPSCSDKKKEAKQQEKTEPAEPIISEHQEEEKRKTAFPTLDILPAGSILRRVKLPRYDSNFRPLSLLTADKLTVIDENEIAAEGIDVIMYDESGKIRGHTEMNQAVYNQQTSTMVAKEAVTLQGDGYTATGKGLVLNFEHGRGFLLGPATTLFQIEQPNREPEKPTSP